MMYCFVPLFFAVVCVCGCVRVCVCACVRARESAWECHCWSLFFGGGGRQATFKLVRVTHQFHDGFPCVFFLRMTHQFHVQVPDAAVSSIVGSGGVVIKEFMQRSGAQITISEEGEYAQGTSNRIVSITGSQSTFFCGEFPKVHAKNVFPITW
jgi:hypothetical protein